LPESLREMPEAAERYRIFGKLAALYPPASGTDVKQMVKLQMIETREFPALVLSHAIHRLVHNVDRTFAPSVSQIITEAKRVLARATGFTGYNPHANPDDPVQLPAVEKLVERLESGSRPPTIETVTRTPEQQRVGGGRSNGRDDGVLTD